MDLRSHYLGLELKSPLVPSASPLSRNMDTVRQLEDSGAAAIVMYSLFEEELKASEIRHQSLLAQQDIGHSEATHHLPLQRHQDGNVLDNYLEQIRRIKESLSIPVIASLNGVSLDGWVTNGKLLAEAGADALELNTYTVAADPSIDSHEMEERYLALLTELRSCVSLPITVKLSPFFSSLGHFVKQLEVAGANGVSLFNRFYQPDIDIDSLRVSATMHLSRSDDSLLAMRWLGILHGRVNVSLAATGGIHTHEDAIKMILAGADITHLCSVLLRHGPRHLQRIHNGMVNWLTDSPYETLEQARGVLSHRQMSNPAAYERASYVEMLSEYQLNRGNWR